MVHLGSILGASWTILGTILGYLGSILGASWTILGPPWTILGTILVHLGVHLGPSWEHLGSILDHLGDPLRHNEPARTCACRYRATYKNPRVSNMGTTYTPKSPERDHQGTLKLQLGSLLGPSWTILGTILVHLGDHLGPSWEHLGSILRATCSQVGGPGSPSWGILGASWAILGPSWDHLGPSWGPSSAILGARWGL